MQLAYFPESVEAMVTTTTVVESSSSLSRDEWLGWQRNGPFPPIRFSFLGLTIDSEGTLSWLQHLLVGCYWVIDAVWKPAWVCFVVSCFFSSHSIHLCGRMLMLRFPTRRVSFLIHPRFLLPLSCSSFSSLSSIFSELPLSMECTLDNNSRCGFLGIHQYVITWWSGRLTHACIIMHYSQIAIYYDTIASAHLLVQFSRLRACACCTSTSLCHRHRHTAHPS